jgi:predicted Fe-S protein YdhL (DUF1289 family)
MPQRISTVVAQYVMPPSAPYSPCISVCSIGPRGVCRGCYRTLEEIADWIRLGPAAQWAVVRAADARRRLEQWPAGASGS